ncbi:Amylo-alpha-1,6-glucosidase [Caballeronia arationis]|uniref:Glycogen debranching enzyme, putative n=1 Tax=Caballeronia arationis TaxID=1777142 RepID=A0A7Z7N2F8_9BURK|nr:amylo-alpha-1,6-glucosidase [Caballeronia arationis]SAK53771.1 Amylo-alpha-1,6-glucosidase [Caballeronia arationis]SOE66165.1 glycogen debranching enzyme, putative [Caballeronia arationis]
MTRVEPPFGRQRLENEWLEADGFGGFASGTVGTMRTRRYHALLLTATQPPAGRVVLVNGVEAWLDLDGTRHPLTMQHYAPDVLYLDASANLLSFDTAPWPTWRYRIGEREVLIAEVFVAKESRETVLCWRFEGRDAPRTATLSVRPLLSGRDYHALHHENPALDFAARIDGERVSWQPYGDLPAIVAATNGVYEHAPDWYRNFCYARERERGLDFTEDLATPGVFSFDLAHHEAVMILSAGADSSVTPMPVPERAAALAAIERQRRTALGSRLQRSADAYVIARRDGHTVLAGFPWFTDWGRDTFISMRGLLIAQGRLQYAESILLEWADMLSEGMLPNRFPDRGGIPEYNAVDASLWFAVAAHDYLATGHALVATRSRLQRAVDAVLEGYSQGTRFGIAVDEDGLVRAGVPGVQLTWMDAKVGDFVVTPRTGKPVEVQALWINALHIAAEWNPRWAEVEARARQSFLQRFVDPSTGALFDLVDADHEPGKIDRSIRPNQIFAVGGLPFALLEGASAEAVVTQVEAHLLTPLGLRTLAPSDPAYRGAYAGGIFDRDSAYHQGTVWPWLIGPFIQAWVRLHGAEGVRERFLAPLYAHLDHGGLDHICEVADGDAPHAPGGTPCQAWSLGELLRIEKLLGEHGG